MFENIKNRLTENANVIDTELSDYFQKDGCECAQLNVAQRYSLLNGGKKIRAFLVLELCRIFGGEVNNAIPYACAIEMIHVSSLIHDDMPCIDNDDYRRGKPATHKAYGEAAALLAGDALMAKAFLAVANNSFLPPDINLKAISILASATGDAGMLAGQGIDVLSTEKVKSLDELIRLHNLKTGALISAAAKLGCLSAGLQESDERFLRAVSYAENVGLAFQIVDDMLDYKEGRIEENSFLSFMPYESAEMFANELTNKAVEEIKPFDNGSLTELAAYLIVRDY